MARIRSIKIGFFQNEDLVALSPHHRLLFEGLWLLADREGRLEDRPKRIKGELFPYEDQLDIAQMLADLAGAGFITRYTARGAAYIAVITFLEHQHPHHKEPPSTIPAPPRVSRGKHPRPTGGSMAQASSNDASSIPGPDGDDPVGSGSGSGSGHGSGNGSGHGDGSGRGDARARADQSASPQAAAVNPHRRADTLINGAEQRRHGVHAWCSWPVRNGLCVPVFLHDEFLGKSGKSDAELRSWYSATNARFTDIAIGEDALVFWRREFAAWIGASAPPPRGRSRGTTPVDASKYAGLTEGDADGN